MRIATLMILLTTAPMAYAQGKPAPKAEAAMPANPISTFLKGNYERTKKFIVASAELMPADQYNFKPTPDVRTFGQLIGHIADAQLMFCSTVKKETLPKKPSAEKLATKAELQKALTEAFAYCDKVYPDSTDATLTSSTVQLFGNTMPKFGALDINIDHDNEHYGNLVTYLRMKKLTPPSSAGGGM